MPSALIIPGVQVRTVFEPSPVLPGATGILGVVGVTDRGPLDPTPLGSFDEFIAAFGPGSRYTMPEVRQAFTNGVSRVVVARTAPGGPARRATLDLLDDDGDTVVRLVARAEGDWGNHVGVRVLPARTLDGSAVKYVDLEVWVDTEQRETFTSLVMDPSSPRNLFAVVNAQSSLVVAIDPKFTTDPPKPVAVTPLTPAAQDRASELVLNRAAKAVVQVIAKTAGPAGDGISVEVVPAQAALALPGPSNGGILVVARVAGDAGADIQAGVAADPADPARRVLRVTPPAPGTVREIGFGTVDEIVAAAASDHDVTVVKVGRGLPDVVADAPLAKRIDLAVRREGRGTTWHRGVSSLAGLTAIADDPLVTFVAATGATRLPDAPQTGYLSGGVAEGQRMLALPGADDPSPLVALVATAPATTDVRVRVDASRAEGDVAAVDIAVFDGTAQVEQFAGLTMDPDSDAYLPARLATSRYISALDLFVRTGTVSLPTRVDPAARLGDGSSPLTDAYQDALDRLEAAEEVDLVIASVANQLDTAGVRTVHQQVVAHCEKMADLARNRIGLGSVTLDEAAQPALVLDHADDVRSDAFVLVTPPGAEGALAGLLGLQDYFASPTFKTVSALGVPLVPYPDAQIESLVKGNVVVIAKRRGLGTIVVKGVSTKGRQINVQRTANKAVRDAKAVAQVYIGRLNDDGARIALRQQLLAMFGRMERDGALVPSTDGTSPAFAVQVFSTQDDFANGIVNVDIAVRPVRAIDYIYARILVQN